MKIFRIILLLTVSGLLLSNPVLAEDDTDKLNGMSITYTYSGGWKFTAKYTGDGISYKMHNYNTGWSETFPYRAFEVEKNVYFTSWYDSGRDDYVTHLIDLNQKRLYGSVLLGKEKVHFESAEINEIQN